MTSRRHAHDAGCREYGLTRRALLSNAALLGAGAVATEMVGDVLTQTVYGATSANVVVVLSLRGGADGLSMVVPYQEANYYAQRPGIAVAKKTLLNANGTFGMHPAFAPLAKRWGSIAAIHSVGLPAPNLSHFSAMETLEEANPGSTARVGWLNRMVGGLAGTDVFEGTQVGSLILPTSLQGPQRTVAVDSFPDMTTPLASNAVLAPRQRASLTAQYASDTTVVGQAARAAFALADKSAPVATVQKKGPANKAAYPSTDLGDAFSRSAALIRSGAGVRAVAIDYGGWDHHTDLTSRMRPLIDEMSRSLNAFFTDLGSLGSRVTVVTLSEFGRRVAQNGSAGVDHGYGNAVLVMGGGVKGGYYARNWQGLGTAKQVAGDLAVTTDYRDVLAEILSKRFPGLSIPTVFPGFTRSANLGFISA